MFKHELPYLLIRLSLGAVLLAHGLLKIFTFTIAGTVSYFSEAYGIPLYATYAVIFGETVGGAAIIIGLYTRLAALLSLPILIGAGLTHIGNGWLFSNQGGGWEYPLILIILAIVIILRGNGIFALKRLPIIDLLVPDIFKS